MQPNQITAYDRLLEQLHGVQGNGTKAKALCPVHEADGQRHTPSLSITRIEGQVLVYCHGGCPIEAVLDALNMHKRDLFDNREGVDYRYEDGRIVHRTPDKQFPQYGNKNGQPTLYQLAKVIEAIRNGQPIYLCEGEKDVHALEAFGVVATTAPMGAGNFDKVDITPLINADIIAIAHQDESGDGWARQVWDKLNGYASLRFKKSAVGNDAADHVAAGKTLHALLDDPRHFEPAGRHLKVVRASDIGMEATEWVWEDEHGKWLPQGAVSLVAGREGVGKSTVVANVVARITKGTLPGEHFGHPKTVIICATEDSWRQTINPRLVAAGADLDKVIRVDAYTPEGFDGTLQLPEDIERVRKIVETYVLIVLDPLMSTLSIKLDTHKDAEVRRGLEPLSRLAHTANLAVVGLIHENKSTASDLLSRIMGSRAFTAVVRAVLYAARRDEDPEQEFWEPSEPQFVFGQAKSNLGRMIPYAIRYHIEGVQVGYDERKQKGIWSSRIVWGTTEDQSVQDIVKAQESVKRDATVTEAKNWLRDYLKGKGEVPSSEALAKGEELGYTRSTVQRARGALRVSVKPVGRSTTWTLLS
jgi:AAA domain